MTESFSTIPQECVNQSIGLSNTLISLMAHTIITASQCSLSPPEMWPEDYGPCAEKYGLREYDFIVIGSGSAGSVLANRLTENHSWKVLVLEAGGNPPAESAVPYMNTVLGSSKVGWGLTGHTSSNFGHAFPNGIPFPSGKMLGGTGSLNGMVYTRGNRRDYQRWQADGNYNWNWETVLKYFKKSENMLATDILNESGLKFHGTFGPMKVDHYHHNPNPLDKILTNGMEELGLSNIIDYNGNNHIGFARLSSIVAGGKRQSTAKVFLAAAKRRKNLHVIKHAHVTALITGSRGQISAVRFTVNGTKEIIARASKEYILSAGTFQTPKILMLSGIGPKSHLTHMGIKTVRDLKVGDNLQDHVMFSYQFQMPPYNLSANYDVLDEYSQYLKYRKGAFAGPYSADFNVFINTVNASSPFPNVQMVYVVNDKRQRELIKYNKGILESNPQEPTIDTISATILLLNPRSRGHVRLRSTNPFDAVDIHANFLDNSEDITELISAIRWQQALQKTKTFEEFQIKEVDVSAIPNPMAEPDSDLYWEQYIRHVAMAGFHTVGTCKMGPSQDPAAVVDPRLRVHGIKNLRVIDASVMPYVPSGNTFAPVVMIAERGADFIKEDWIKKQQFQFETA